jgi:hypothetical protein
MDFPINSRRDVLLEIILILLDSSNEQTSPGSAGHFDRFSRAFFRMDPAKEKAGIPVRSLYLKSSIGTP